MTDPEAKLPVENLHGAVRAFVLRLVRDAALADDLAQDVFVRAQTAGNPCRDQTAIQGWLYRIALNVVRDHFRTLKRRAPEVAIDESALAAPSGEDVENTVLQREMSDCILEHLEQVPSPQHEALVLHDMIGLSHREIGKLLGVSEGNARVLLHRGRTFFRSVLDQNCVLDFVGDAIPCDRRPSDERQEI